MAESLTKKLQEMKEHLRQYRETILSPSSYSPHHQNTRRSKSVPRYSSSDDSDSETDLSPHYTRERSRNHNTHTVNPRQRRYSSSENGSDDSDIPTRQPSHKKQNRVGIYPRIIHDMTSTDDSDESDSYIWNQKASKPAKRSRRLNSSDDEYASKQHQQRKFGYYRHHDESSDSMDYLPPKSQSRHYRRHFSSSDSSQDDISDSNPRKYHDSSDSDSGDYRSHTRRYSRPIAMSSSYSDSESEPYNTKSYKYNISSDSDSDSDDAFIQNILAKYKKEPTRQFDHSTRRASPPPYEQRRPRYATTSVQTPRKDNDSSSFTDSDDSEIDMNSLYQHHKDVTKGTAPAVSDGSSSDSDFDVDDFLAKRGLQQYLTKDGDTTKSKPMFSQSDDDDDSDAINIQHLLNNIQSDDDGSDAARSNLSDNSEVEIPIKTEVAKRPKTGKPAAPKPPASDSDDSDIGVTKSTAKPNAPKQAVLDEDDSSDFDIAAFMAARNIKVEASQHSDSSDIVTPPNATHKSPPTEERVNKTAPDHSSSDSADDFDVNKYLNLQTHQKDAAKPAPDDDDDSDFDVDQFLASRKMSLPTTHSASSDDDAVDATTPTQSVKSPPTDKLEPKAPLAQDSDDDSDFDVDQFLASRKAALPPTKTSLSDEDDIEIDAPTTAPTKTAQSPAASAVKTDQPILKPAKTAATQDSDSGEYFDVQKYLASHESSSDDDDKPVAQSKPAKSPPKQISSDDDDFDVEKFLADRKLKGTQSRSKDAPKQHSSADELEKTSPAKGATSPRQVADDEEESDFDVDKFIASRLHLQPHSSDDGKVEKSSKPITDDADQSSSSGDADFDVDKYLTSRKLDNDSPALQSLSDADSDAEINKSIASRLAPTTQPQSEKTVRDIDSDSDDLAIQMPSTKSGSRNDRPTTIPSDDDDFDVDKFLASRRSPKQTLPPDHANSDDEEEPFDVDKFIASRRSPKQTLPPDHANSDDEEEEPFDVDKFIASRRSPKQTLPPDHANSDEEEEEPFDVDKFIASRRSPKQTLSPDHANYEEEEPFDVDKFIASHRSPKQTLPPDHINSDEEEEPFDVNEEEDASEIHEIPTRETQKNRSANSSDAHEEEEDDFDVDKFIASRLSQTSATPPSRDFDDDDDDHIDVDAYIASHTSRDDEIAQQEKDAPEPLHASAATVESDFDEEEDFDVDKFIASRTSQKDVQHGIEEEEEEDAYVHNTRAPTMPSGSEEEEEDIASFSKATQPVTRDGIVTPDYVDEEVEDIVEYESKKGPDQGSEDGNDDSDDFDVEAFLAKHASKLASDHDSDAEHFDSDDEDFDVDQFLAKHAISKPTALSSDSDIDLNAMEEAAKSRATGSKGEVIHHLSGSDDCDLDSDTEQTVRKYTEANSSD